MTGSNGIIKGRTFTNIQAGSSDFYITHTGEKCLNIESQTGDIRVTNTKGMVLSSSGTTDAGVWIQTKDSNNGINIGTDDLGALNSGTSIPITIGHTGSTIIIPGELKAGVQTTTNVTSVEQIQLQDDTTTTNYLKIDSAKTHAAKSSGGTGSTDRQLIIDVNQQDAFLELVGHSLTRTSVP